MLRQDLPNDIVPYSFVYNSEEESLLINVSTKWLKLDTPAMRKYGKIAREGFRRYIVRPDVIEITRQLGGHWVKQLAGLLLDNQFDIRDWLTEIIGMQYVIMQTPLIGKDITVFRGYIPLALPFSLAKPSGEYMMGETIVNWSFLSTSLYPHFPATPIQIHGTESKNWCMFKITIPANFHVYYIDYMNTFKQYEVLLPAGMVFKVIDDVTETYAVREDYRDEVDADTLYHAKTLRLVHLLVVDQCEPHVDEVNCEALVHEGGKRMRADNQLVMNIATCYSNSVPALKHLKCEACHTVGATMMCSICNLSVYCNKECQQKSWHDHGMKCGACSINRN